MALKSSGIDRGGSCRQWAVHALAAVGLAWGPAAQGADLMELYGLALENDRTLSAAENQYRAVQQARKQATRQYFPNLTASYEHSETHQDIISSENEVFDRGTADFPTDTFSVTLTQPLFRWDLFVERRAAGAEARQAEYTFASAQQGLMLRTAEAYMNGLAASDAVELAAGEADAVEQQMNRAERRLEVGMANATEVHESRARYQLTRSDLIQARTARADATEALVVISGREPGPLAPLALEIDLAPPNPPEVDDWIERALENNLDIKAAEAAVEAALQERKRQRADLYPNVDLVASFNKRDTGGSLFGGGSEVDTAEVLVRAEWNLFQGGTIWARSKEAQFALQRARDELVLQRREVRRATRNAFNGVMDGISRVRALEQSMEAQALTVDAKQKGFETGANSNLEVLDAQRDFYLARRDYLQARYNYVLSVLELKRQVGDLSPADLERVNNMLAGSEAAGDEGLDESS